MMYFKLLIDLSHVGVGVCYCVHAVVIFSP